MISRKKPDWQLDIAKERIGILLSLAKKCYGQNPDRSRRYVWLARKIGLRYNFRLKEMKRDFCKKCNTILTPGKTSDTNLDSKTGTIVIKCKNCNYIFRYPYK